MISIKFSKTISGKKHLSHDVVSDICNGNEPIISSIQALALKIDVAFPIQDTYASTLSRSMIQLQSSNELEFERFLDPYMTVLCTR